jgi:hypothetical protein
VVWCGTYHVFKTDGRPMARNVDVGRNSSRNFFLRMFERLPLFCLFPLFEAPNIGL